VGRCLTVERWEGSTTSIGRPEQTLGRFAVAPASDKSREGRGGSGLTELVSMQVYAG
jgi:hypothetical protein